MVMLRHPSSKQKGGQWFESQDLANTVWTYAVFRYATFGHASTVFLDAIVVGDQISMKNFFVEKIFPEV
eukprot:4231434-Karenia_brevis.AAC.1